MSMSDKFPQWSKAAQWIWLPDYVETDAEAKFVHFRKTFQLESKPNSPALVHVSADTRYRLFVNGHSVSFGPCKSYVSAWSFETVDISTFCNAGTNVIAARVLRFSPFYPGNSSFMRANVPGFILHGSVSGLDLSTTTSWKCQQDDSTQIVPIEEWDYSFGPPFLRLHEVFDGRIESCGWNKSSFEEAGWSDAVPQIAKRKMLPIVEPRKLRARTIPVLPEEQTSFSSALKCSAETEEGLDQWDELLQHDKPLCIPASSKSHVIVEAAALTTGFLQFNFQKGLGSRIQILSAEGFEQRIDDTKTGLWDRVKGDRADFENGVLKGPEDTIIVGGETTADHRSTYSTFWFRTFRYIKLSISTGAVPLTIENFNYRETRYPLEVVTDIAQMGGVENEAIWRISLNTLRNCMHETYEDCPYYEQNQFAHDSRLMMLFTYQLSHDDRLARKTIDEFHASQQPNGLIQTNFPNAYNVVTIPQFSLYWVLMLYDHMMYFGDAKLVRKYIGAADAVLDYFQNVVANNGLVGRFDDDYWPFVDWVEQWSSADGNFLNMAVPPAYKATGFATYNSLLYAMTLQHCAELADFIGRHDTATEYRARAASTNDAVNRHCFNGEYYLDGPGRPTSERSQHVQVFAILSGAASAQVARAVLPRAMQDPSFAKCTYAMQFYVFRAAERAGVYADLFPLLLQPWRRMLQLNLTTCPEAEAMPRSDCHGWSACPLYEMVAAVFGLRPAQPGFGTISFAPRRDLLPEAEGRFVVAAKGEIQLSWTSGKPVSILSTSDIRVEVILNGNAKRYINVKKGETIFIE